MRRKDCADESLRREEKVVFGFEGVNDVRSCCNGSVMSCPTLMEPVGRGAGRMTEGDMVVMVVVVVLLCYQDRPLIPRAVG